MKIRLNIKLGKIKLALSMENAAASAASPMFLTGPQGPPGPAGLNGQDASTQGFRPQRFEICGGETEAYEFLVRDVRAVEVVE